MDRDKWVLLFRRGGAGVKNFTQGLSREAKISIFLVSSEKVGLYSEGLGGQNSTLVRSFEFSVVEICVGATLRFYTVRPKIVLEPREVSF